MSTRSTIRIPLTIPEAIQSQKYTVKFSVHPIKRNGTLDHDEEYGIFLDKTYKPADLQDGAEPNQKIAVIDKNFPRWNPAVIESDRKVGFKAYIWKGEKLMQTTEFGPV